MRNGPPKPPVRPRRRVRKLPLVLMSIALVLGIAAAILSFIDIGGQSVLDMAQKAVKEGTGMILSAAGVRGNPIRGYTFADIALTAGNGERILSAKTLSGRINFFSLLRGAPRLSVLSVGGIAMDLDQFIAEIQRIDLPEGGGDSEVPIDRVSLRSSRFTSKWGTVDVDEVGADIQGTDMAIDAAGTVNGIPVRGTADLDVRGGSLSINKAEVGFGKAKILATGGLQPVSSSDSTTTMDLQGSVRGLDLKELSALWPAFLESEDFDGSANLDLEAKGTSDTLRLSGTLDYKGAKLGGYPVERFGAQLRYADQRLTLNDIQGSVLSIPIDGELAVAMRPGQHPSIMVKLQGRDASLEDLGKTFPTLAGMRGKVSDFTANIQGPTDALNGVVSLSAPRIELEGKGISDLALQVKLAKSDRATVNGKFLFEKSQGYIQGTVASLPASPRLDLTVKLVELDVTRIADLIPDSEKYGLAGKVNATLGIKGTPSAPALAGTLQSPSFKAQGYTLVNPSVSFAYAKDVLTLQKSSGTLDGMPIQLTGTVKGLTSKTPAIDMRAQLSMSSDSLKAYVPDIANYKLKGEIRAGVKIEGKLPAPKISLVATSPALSALGNVSVKNLEVSTALGGNLSKSGRINVAIKAERAAASGAALSDISAEVAKEGPVVTLTSLSARSGPGTLSGSGTATFDGKNSKLNLNFDLDRLELAPLAAASGADLKGAFSGNLKLSGSPEAPELSLKGQSPAVTAQGAVLSHLALDLSGTPEAMKLNAFKAEVGGAPLTATGTIRTSPSVAADIAVRGDGLDLEALTAGYPDLKGQIKGKADLTFNLSGSGKGNRGTGALSAAAVEAFGLRLSNVRLPLSLEEDAFKSSNGTLDLYGGRAKNNLTFDLKTLKFSDTITASGVDVNALAQDASGGLGGKITGQGSLSLKLSGSAGKAPGYIGTGQFTLGPGGISGFKGLDVATRLYGVNALRYTKVSVPLEIQTGRLILKKGAVANAPDGDPLYRYARLAEDGTIKFDKTLYLMLEGNVNFQLLNALAGGALGGAGALLQGGAKQLTTGAGFEGLLKGALQGGRQGGAEADFRDVTAKVSGKAESPSVSLVKVGPSSRPRQEPPATTSADVPTTEAPKKRIEEQITDTLIDALAPKKPQPAPVQEQPKTEEAVPSSSEPEPPAPSMEEQLKQRVGDELKKGLEGLFK
ncbi:MAG: translocation/assembly module TamB domain-containing protein [Fretibacterium sp.]|nr:translocation/assembly module TamB domain-containing protein [Fretibacterium sp.]